MPVICRLCASVALTSLHTLDTIYQFCRDFDAILLLSCCRESLFITIYCLV